MNANDKYEHVQFIHRMAMLDSEALAHAIDALTELRQHYSELRMVVNDLLNCKELSLDRDDLSESTKRGIAMVRMRIALSEQTGSVPPGEPEEDDDCEDD